jgi:hypothetical protein
MESRTTPAGSRIKLIAVTKLERGKDLQRTMAL